MSTDSLHGDKEKADARPAADGQVEKLAEIISRSQHSYRELIDNLDQALFTLSLKGEVRVANLRLAETLGASFQELIGHPLSEFIESPTLADVERALPAFLKKGVWAGKLPVRLKKDKEVHFFDCWLQTVLENGEVTAVTGWARDVTAQHESEIRFAELFESLSEGILFVTPEGQLLDANPALVRMLGYESKKELQRHNFREMHDDPSTQDAIHRELTEKGFIHDREIVLRRKDGKRIYCLTSGFAIRDASGRPIRLQGTLVDVTERREMEKRLQEEQGFVRRLVENFPDLIAVLDREGRFIYVSGDVQNILGRSPKEYIGGVFGERANEEDRAKLHAMLQRVVRGEEARAQVEFRARHTNGSWRILLATASPLFDEDGKISGVVTSARDVTETREIEKKLRREQEFTRRLIECFPDLIIVIDAEGRFAFVSESVRDILGVSPEEYISKPIGQRVGGEDRAELVAMYGDIMSGRKSNVQTEIRARHIDGTWKTLRVSVNPLSDENGRITGMVSSGRDVTELKQAEHQLAQREKFSAMGHMMAGAAHELNNPLTAILGVSDLLRERATDDTTRRQVDLILQQARRAAAIVQNLLAFSRPATATRLQVSLDQIVREALQIEQAALARKNIRVNVLAPGDLPPVEGDRKLLQQVFLNILVNAEQSIAAAKDHGTIEITLSRKGERIRVTIADDGPGIPPESIGKVFDPFFTTKRPSGGSGLGLTICLAVVKEHGGTIEVESKPGSGATLHVFLPVAAEAAVSAPAPSQPTARSAPPGSEALRGRSVLIVDDEESIREIVQESLSARGMKVGAAESSEAALSYLASNTCDIILCDFNLPGMKGDQLFEKVRAQRGGSPARFVFMTGDLVDPAVIEKYREKGALVLQKPFQISALTRLLTELLQPQPSQTT
ncbi:MAG: PAS domain S-box protein [Acidobacteriia bacterium]|nr:PAS domain S-box protein [Terriglobia bacterium]